MRKRKRGDSVRDVGVKIEQVMCMCTCLTMECGLYFEPGLIKFVFTDICA